MFSWFRYAATITEGDHKCKRWFMHPDENLLANHGSEKISETEGESVTRQKKRTTASACVRGFGCVAGDVSPCCYAWR